MRYENVLYSLMKTSSQKQRDPIVIYSYKWKASAINRELFILSLRASVWNKTLFSCFQWTLVSQWL